MSRTKHGFPYQAGVIDVGAHSTRLDLFEVASGGKITLRELWTLRTKGDDNVKEKSDRRQTYFNRSEREE